MDIHSLIKYFWSIPRSTDRRSEPYTEEKSTFVLRATPKRVPGKKRSGDKGKRKITSPESE